MCEEFNKRMCLQTKLARCFLCDYELISNITRLICHLLDLSLIGRIMNIEFHCLSYRKCANEQWPLSVFAAAAQQRATGQVSGL